MYSPSIFHTDRCILRYRTMAVVMYGCVFFVVGVLVTLTSASDSLQTVVGGFEAVKDKREVAQCATSPANVSITAR